VNTFELNGGLLALSSWPFHNYNPNNRVRFFRWHCCHHCQWRHCYRHR